MAGNPFTRSVLEICADRSNSTKSEACRLLESNAAGALLLSGIFQLLGLFMMAWIWSQSVKVFKRVQRSQNVTRRGMSEATSADMAWKDQIAKLEDVPGPDESEVNGELNHPSEGKKYSMIPVSVSVSDSRTKDKLLEKTEMFDAVDVLVQPGTSLLQSKVVLNQQSMSMLHNLAVEGTKRDENFTVQLSRWRLFIHTAGGVETLKLDDAHEVPTILHAAYAAGKLTIEGFNLEGAEIKAATFFKSITLKDLTKQEVGGVQIWTSIVRLPSNNLSEVFVYATKPMCINDHKVVVRSSVRSVEDHNLRILLRVGIPSTIALVYVTILFTKLFSFDKWRFVAPAFVWILPPIVMALTQILPQSTEEAVEACIERLGLATAALGFGAQRLFFSQDPEYAGCSRIASTLPQAHSLKSSGCKKPDKNTENSKTQSKSADGAKPLRERQKARPRGSKTGPLIEEEPQCLVYEEYLDDNGRTQPLRERQMARPRGYKKGLKIEEEPQCFVYEEYRDDFRRTLVRQRDVDTDSDEAHPESFRFIHGLKSKMWKDRDYFSFSSNSGLIEVFQKFMPEKFNFMGSSTLKVMASEFFHVRRCVKEALDSLAEDATPGAQSDKLRAHLKYFWQFLSTTCQEVSDRYEAMKKEGSVSWDMLWAFFPLDTRVAYACATSDEEICGLAQSTQYSLCEPDGVPKLWIVLKGWDYDCKAWKPCSKIRCKIPEYSGRRHFTSLGTHPLEFKADPAGATKQFLAKGAWFGALSMQSRNRFMHYKGLMYRQTRQGVVKDAVNGRVMIDLSSFAKMNPDYPLGAAAPASDTLRTDHVELIDISAREDRMYAPTIVYGFSFQIKKWGAFNIDGFEEVVFNETAYEALVMESRKKETIYSLVHEYKRTDDTLQRVDPIVGKGQGCILLCYGPPGTGKTFTAESISEKLHAPLWCLSVSELGTTPDVLEKKLVKIMDVAASWGAILLLDEADVYLEKRSSGTMDLERNAMTGIFLRNLEYYKGVLFLTTNRVVAFDDAFCSRISMFLFYANHTEQDRRTIWKNLLEPLHVPDLGEFLDTDYASFQLNAREIRNVVQVARTLARVKGEEVKGVYLRQSLETLASSLLELKRVTGEVQTSNFMGILPSP